MTPEQFDEFIDQIEDEEVKKAHVEAYKEITDALTKILRKSQKSLRVDEKAFLQARRDYLSEKQQDEYKEVLEEELPRPDADQAEVDALTVQLTRQELIKIAKRLGVKDADKLTNPALMEAIDEIKEEEAKEEKKKAKN